MDEMNLFSGLEALGFDSLDGIQIFEGICSGGPWCAGTMSGL